MMFILLIEIALFVKI